MALQDFFNKYQPIARKIVSGVSKGMFPSVYGASSLYSGAKSIPSAYSALKNKLVGTPTQLYPSASNRIATRPGGDYVIQKPYVNAPTVSTTPLDIQRPDLSALDNIGNAGGGSAYQGYAPQSYNYEDVIKRASDMQRKLNQPQIQELQGQQKTLSGRYNELLASIKGTQQTAENQQTLTTTRELGRRGISSDSGLAEQELTSALAPVRSSFQGLLASTGASQAKDLATIGNAIAQLKAGDPTAMVNLGLSIPRTEADIANVYSTIGARGREAGSSDLLSTILSMALNQQSAQGLQEQVGKRPPIESFEG